MKRFLPYLPMVAVALFLSISGLTTSRLRSAVVHVCCVAKRHRGVVRELPQQPAGARVIYRSPVSWNSCFWIGVGKGGGAQLDAPVVIGDVLVGVVDYVGLRHSRVRLLSDSGFVPSVRVLRDGELLAKGELSGTSAPLWRGGAQRLQGVGFNYDHADEAGPARDLRTGLSHRGGTPTPLVQEGDLLVTTGMDGVLPPGLRVATVDTVATLREGASTYSLTAYPILDLEEVETVQLLEPLQFAPKGIERAIR